jgi:dihydrofolate reductase
LDAIVIDENVVEVYRMAKLIYVTNVSLDRYIEDEHGSLDWGEPSDELFAFITDLVRPVGTYLYGRRMYDTMAVKSAQPRPVPVGESERQGRNARPTP